MCLSYPQRPSYEVFVAIQAADEYEFSNFPANRFDWILVNARATYINVT